MHKSFEFKDKTFEWKGCRPSLKATMWLTECYIKIREGALQDERTGLESLWTVPLQSLAHRKLFRSRACLSLKSKAEERSLDTSSSWFPYVALFELFCAAQAASVGGGKPPQWTVHSGKPSQCTVQTDAPAAILREKSAAGLVPSHTSSYEQSKSFSKRHI